MTQDELMLFKELLKETIRSTVKEAVQEEVSALLKKDLKEVKLLVAKSIKESMAIKEAMESAPVSNQRGFTDEERMEFKQKLREAVGGDDFRSSITNKRAPIPSIPQDAAMNMSVNGTLPDFDAPIPMIKKDSIAWKELQERIK